MFKKFFVFIRECVIDFFDDEFTVLICFFGLFLFVVLFCAYFNF